MNKKNYSGAAIVCSHVASGTFPITYAERSKSNDATDTGWQFVCNQMPHDDVADVKIWALDEVIELDPSLKGFLNSPPGTRISRVNSSAPWKTIE
jgi:hypothetical protein